MNSLRCLAIILLLLPLMPSPVVARYEEFDQGFDISDKKEKVWTVGGNWYAKGHTLKIGMNWPHTTFERQATGRLARDNKKDVFQVQGQLYFWYRLSNQEV